MPRANERPHRPCCSAPLNSNRQSNSRERDTSWIRIGKCVGYEGTPHTKIAERKKNANSSEINGLDGLTGTGRNKAKCGGGANDTSIQLGKSPKISWV